MIIYSGPSMLDGKPIVAIATGLGKGKASSNVKTGSMVQVWILRSDINPNEALRSGDDVSICGNCPHRPDQGVLASTGKVKRTCYVNMAFAPNAVYKTFQRGGYPVCSQRDMGTLFAGRKVRIGAYGDPAAVPADVWSRCLVSASAVTGYTHQWRSVSRIYSSWCMASCDCEQDRVDAKALGYRTFRVRSELEPIVKGEAICPASEEKGHKLTCESCTSCDGCRTGRKSDIVIIVHGSGKGNFKGLAMAPTPKAP